MSEVLNNSEKKIEVKNTERNWAVLAHLSVYIVSFFALGASSATSGESEGMREAFTQFGSGIGEAMYGILPLLAIYLTKGRESKYIGHHAREALNFYLTSLVVMIPCGILFIILGAGAVAKFMPAIVLIVILIVPFIAAIILYGFWYIKGAVRASREELYRYPFCIRFIKG